MVLEMLVSSLCATFVVLWLISDNEFYLMMCLVSLSVAYLITAGA